MKTAHFIAAFGLALGVVGGCGLVSGLDRFEIAVVPGGGGAGGGSGGAASVGGGGGQGGGCGCADGQTCCDGECVDLLTDEGHCGTCARACMGTICAVGECTNMCISPFNDCDKNLANGCEADLGADPSNCGSCAIACPAGASCVAGACSCPAGFADCDNNPVDGCEADLAADPLHCGQCGVACAPNQDCAGGKCACAPGLEDCNMDMNDGCEAPLDSVLRCGACSNACGPNSVCADGACACAPGLLDCDGLPGCESSAASPLTCGACGVVCMGGLICDGISCASDCMGGQTNCSGSCVDLQSDVFNCGACGAAVGPNQTCVLGAPACESGWGDCTASPGCETSTVANAQSCGACGAACKPGAVCVQGSCVCSGATPKDCGAACRVCCSDADCGDGDGCTGDTCAADGSSCGHAGCGAGTFCCSQIACNECCSDVDCGGNLVCSGGVCSSLCANGLTLCAGQCVDVSTDPKNCDGCGIACGSDGTCACSGGACSGGTIYFSEDFSDNFNTWMFNPPWEIGPAAASSGQDAGSPDPAMDRSATSDNGVAGIVIGGNLTMPANAVLESKKFDTSSAPGALKLTFWRWLNNPAGTIVSVECSTGMGLPKTLWTSSDLIMDAAWTKIELDATVCKSSKTKVRFTLSNTMIDAVMSGWNIDDVTVSTGACN